MNKKLIIFDMDGTILNTLDDLADSLNYALDYCGYPGHSLSEVRSFVGNGIRRLIERSLPTDISVKEIDKVHTVFTEYYKIHCADKTVPYDGIPELLLALRNAGYLTAVVSNKADYAVQELCLHYFEGLFDAAVGERSGIQRKPAPDSVYAVMEKLQIEKEQAVYIGDSEVDIATAKNAGIYNISVEWGFRDPDFLIMQGAEHIVSTPQELQQIFIPAP